jgi:eukaryotic-like serine/threonine-protein kinase
MDGETVQDRRWRETEELFHRAVDLPAGEWSQRLDEWCGGDLALRESVLALLAADSTVEELISAGAPADTGDYLERDDTGNADGQDGGEDRWIGRVLGAFRLERLLGRGGMGVVYLAERVSGGFTQQAAIKLVGRHLRSSPAVAQFLIERETLARLEHANIARLLDGGVTSEGFPYVAMEYVEGRRLDTACDDPATSIDQILRWMLQLCDAVGYVHRNLILHRDLKPGNVMVTEDGSDGGQIKLLDFGTLKRMGPEGDADSAMTQAGMRAVTIRYASPEHIQGARVSTATDVYSLGMMLYRLIAGRLPEELEDLPIGEYLERLKEGRFKPPSQVAAGQTPPRKLDLQMARDLDAIVAKATRYEAESRYPTTNALAEDIWSVLLHRPVTAREGSLRYRAAKFYRRYRWPVRAAAAALAVLAAGLSAMAWQGHVAHLQELRAEKGVEDERQLAHMLLSDYFEKLNVIPGSIDAQRRAVTQALAYLDSLARIAPGSDLETDTIRGFTEMGDLLGDPYSQNLGNVPEAIGTLNKAISIGEMRVNKHPQDLESLMLLMKAQTALGGTYLGNGDAIRAEPVLQSALATARVMSSDPHATAEMLRKVSSITDLLGNVYDPTRGYATADMDKAVQYYNLSNKYDEMCDQADPKAALCSTGLVVGDYLLGALVEDSDPALAASYYRHGLNFMQQFPPEKRNTTVFNRGRNYMHARLGLMEIRIGPMAEGIAFAREGQAGFRESIAKADLDNRARFDLVAVETDLGIEYGRYGKEQESAETAREALGLLAVVLQRSPQNVLWQMIQAENLMTLGRAEMKLGHKSVGGDAERRGMEQAVRLAESKDASPDALGFAAEDLIELGKSPKDAQTALSFAQRAVNSFAKPMPSQLLTLAKAQAGAGQQQQAAKTARAVLAGLAGPVKSKIVADEIAEARRLMKS